MNSSRISELLKTRPKTNGYWGLYLGVVGQGAQPELGMAIAKKFAKRAVDRNRLKRMVRELVWQAQTKNINSDVVVKLKKPIGRETKGRLRLKEKKTIRAHIVEML